MATKPTEPVGRFTVADLLPPPPKTATVGITTSYLHARGIPRPIVRKSRSWWRNEADLMRALTGAPAAYTTPGGPLTSPAYADAVAAVERADAAVRTARDVVASVRAAHPLRKDATPSERDALTKALREPEAEADGAARALRRAREALAAAIWDVSDDVTEARHLAFIDAAKAAHAEAVEHLGALTVALEVRESAYALMGYPRSDTPRERHWSEGGGTEWGHLAHAQRLVLNFPTAFLAPDVAGEHYRAERARITADTGAVA